jgi:hypothetical protein
MLEQSLYNCHNYVPLVFREVTSVYHNSVLFISWTWHYG